MAISDAFVTVSCDRPRCRSTVQIDLPFTYGGTMHAQGHYDHADRTVEKILARDHPEWIVAGDGKHYCSEACDQRGERGQGTATQ